MDYDTFLVKRMMILREERQCSQEFALPSE
jgi:hypothetical protein